MASRIVVLLVVSWAVLGCGPGDRPRVPDAASGMITTAAAIPTTTGVVTCSGPADQIAALGSLCSGASAFHRIGVPTSGAMLVRGSGAGAYLVIVGYPPAGTPESGPFDASMLTYSAFMVVNGPTSGVVSEIEAWRQGTSLAGSLVSTSFSLAACSTSWVGGGTLTFGGVTLTLSWSSAIPC